jgi:hypothetical protein
MTEDFLPPEVTEDADAPKKVDRRSKAFRDMIAKKKAEEAVEAPPVEAVEETITIAWPQPTSIFEGRSAPEAPPPPKPAPLVSQQTLDEMDAGRANLRKLTAR